MLREVLFSYELLKEKEKKRLVRYAFDFLGSVPIRPRLPDKPSWLFMIAS